MTGKALGRTFLIALALLACAPGFALAQSAIAGVVKDTSGAVLPGVNVEAASPALIEGTRAVVSDAFGQYKIVDLRPGVYTVTFSLQGFNTVKRQGIELTTNFTAPVNAELQVGSLQETVTVSGASPMVDVQQAVTQQVLPQALLDAVPTGGRNIQSVGAVLVGVTQSAPDVGGAAGMQQNYLAAHGTDPRDVTIMVDGIRLNGIEGDGAIQQYFNEGMFSEMSYQTGGMAADTAGGGVRLNMIPKDGGNTFRGDVFFSATGQGLQADSFPPDVQALGLKSGNFMSRMHDVNVSAGGPLVASKLWFFGSFRHWGVDQSVAQSFAALPNTPQLTSFTADTSSPVIDTNTIKSFMGRVTYQASPRHKFSYYLDRVIKFRGNEQNSPSGTSPTEWAADTFSTRQPRIYYMTEAKYTGTWSSKLLFEAGLGINNESYTTGQLQPSLENCLAAGSCAPAPRVDLGTGVFWGGPAGPYYFRSPIRDTLTSSLSYVTGSHAIKVGMELSHGLNNLQQNYQNPNINFVQRYQNGVPNSVSIVNSPIDEHDRSNELGVYAQDTWTFKKLTLTPGIRWEYFSAKYLDEGIPLDQQRLLTLEGYPARPLFPETNMPTFKNWSPRFGAAYDVFGNGKTALKFSANKYMVAYSTVTFPQAYNPMALTTDTRTWTDVNHDNVYEPGIDTLGPSTNALFGQVFRCPAGTSVTIAGTQPCANLPQVQRPYDVEINTSVQHEVRPGLSVSFGFYHRSYHNLIYSDNPLLDAPGAFTPVTVANPCATNAGTCGGVAPATLTLYAINPALIGKGYLVDKNSDVNSRVYNGFEETFMWRYKGAQIFGGASTQRQISNNCQSTTVGATTVAFANASDPNYAGNFCDQTQFSIPFVTQVKLGGMYPLPYALLFSGTFQSYPGTTGYGSTGTNVNWVNVSYLATSANTPGLTKGQATETVPALVPGSLFLPRWNQLDLRVARKFKVYGTNLQVQMDIFNALNSHPETATSTSIGSNLVSPVPPSATAVLQSRLISFGAQLHF